MKEGDRNSPPFYLHLAIDTTEILSQRVFKRKMRDNCVLPKRLGYNYQRLWQKDRWEAISSFVAVVYWMLTLKDAKTGFASKQDEENISKYKQVSKRSREELKFRRNYQKERSKVRRKQFNQSFFFYYFQKVSSFLSIFNSCKGSSFTPSLWILEISMD